MSEKQVLRWIDPDTAGLAVPNNDGCRITHVGIGVHREVNSYASSNGGAVEQSRDYYDFGVGIENHSATSVRLRFVIGEHDRDGYLTRKIPVSSDIGPGEKQRVWGNLRVEGQARFAALFITEISVGSVPMLLERDDAWETVHPKRSIFDAFQLATNRLPIRLPQQFVLPLIVGGIIVVIFLCLWIS